MKRIINLIILILLITGCSSKLKNNSNTSSSVSESPENIQEEFERLNADNLAYKIIVNIARAQKIIKSKWGTYTDDALALRYQGPKLPRNDGNCQWKITSASEEHFTATSTNRKGSGIVFKVDETGKVTPPWDRTKLNELTRKINNMSLQKNNSNQ